MSYIAAGLTLLALAIVAAGSRLSGRSRRPTLLRVGVVTTGLGLILLWALPWWLFNGDRGEWAMPMFVGTLVVAGSALALGLQLIGRAFGAREHSRSDALIDDLIRQNDLP